jgi:hypothetical protein
MGRPWPREGIPSFMPRNLSDISSTNDRVCFKADGVSWECGLGEELTRREEGCGDHH